MKFEFSKKLVSEALGQSVGFAPTRITTDSRTATSGDLFFALSGEKFDGHDFVEGALERGAEAAVISKERAPELSKKFSKDKLYIVPDTLAALRNLANLYRNTLKIPIFAVGGSNGKTTTKELLAFLLSTLHGKESVFRTKKSENSILGVALSMLAIRSEKFAILEIGIDEPGWMEKHLSIVRPTHGLITTINEEHLELLKSIEVVAEEELKLLGHIRKNKGAFAANLDSQWIRVEELPDDSLTYSMERPADIEGLFQKPQTLHAFGKKFVCPLPGKHNAQNLLAALCGLRLLEPNLNASDLNRIVEALPNFQGEAHRSLWKIYPGDKGLYDDCYNANPTSMESALQIFEDLAQGWTTLVVLGDMLDLGDQTEAAHARVLNLVAVGGYHHVYLYGENFQQAFDKMKIRPKSFQHFSDITDLKEELSQNLKNFTAVFLKGSRGMKLERLIEVFDGHS